MNEFLCTLGALVWRVDMQLEVFPEERRVDEFASAEATMVRLVSGVYYHVLAEMLLASEFLWTNRTDKLTLCIHGVLI